ncbi:uncharacterized protein CIMG_10146 [Coccidioides immitis RS]|uniref:Uncharacterized protein n=2 Tax=Coccidioides immitis TaxID=5501 RepID=J3K0X1_COCIM|nr:uncharacterized protein CIMG_10146 [Coccidioides immitis RS]EAS27541.3 hypothetical protein CIMG_10146 [Coccidioides immitis RS]KMP09499.1 hypothetical protein CIRG_09669 [Coccidioides immitis RMSCC 2394]TPX20308.1 hypothetical protein DIZ76_016196 [Coccidioides immitis]
MGRVSNGSIKLPASDLTPVKIRGKKKRPRKQFDGVEVDGDRSTQETDPSRESSVFFEKRGPRKKRKDKNKTSKPRESKSSIGQLSLLELLPVELIQQIFIECLELNLPRASPHLADVLSTSWVYSGLIMLAFWNDPAREDDDSQDTIRRMFRPFRYIPMDNLERQLFQLSVLSCRWCTQERIEALIRRMTKLSLHRWISISKHRVTSHFDFDAMAESIERGHGTVHHLRYLQNVPLPFTPSLEINNLETLSLLPLQFPISVLAFPDKVLRGSPWTESKVRFLEFLWQYVMIAENRLEFWLTFASRESIQEGIHSAISEHNLRALRDILALDDSCYQSHDNRLHQVLKPYLLPEEYFIIASRQGEYATAILRLLVRAAPLSVPSDDPELTEWAIKSQNKQNVFGSWLIQYMRDVPVLAKSEDTVFSEGCPQPTLPLYGWDYKAVFGVGRLSWTAELLETVYKK